MTSNLKLRSLAVASSCPEQSYVLSRPVVAGTAGPSGLGAALSGGFGVRVSVEPGSVLRGAVLRGVAMRERSDRPTQAPAAAVVAHASAMANGAGTQAAWADATPFAGDADAIAAKQQTTRAFRGLEPWRDPA